MAYQYNKPLAADIISASQVDLQNNFIALDVAFKVDHVQYNLGDQGKHNIVRFPNQTVVPATWPPALNGSEIALYAESGNLFLRPATATTAGDITNDINLTASTNANPGWFRLPCGIIVKIGKGNVSASDSGAYVQADIINGTGIPSITTVIGAFITKYGTPNELGFTFLGMNDTASTVTISGQSVQPYKILAWAVKPFSGSNTSDFYYIVLGV